jgi:ABC-type cobalamin/Fe3+-siderophores transport system ATPase subunit
MNGIQPVLEIKEISASFGTVNVFHNISLIVERNERWAIIGRNGTGKSTLIKCVAGLYVPEKGSIVVDGVAINKYTARKRSEKVAYVPQKPDGVIPYSVLDYVMLGRYGSMGLLGIPTSKDVDTVNESIDICGIRNISGRLMNTLSGGELQRVLLAGAVAQQTPVLLLDEPATFLDPAHEQLFYNALEQLHCKRVLTTLMVTHDINAAIAQCTHIAALLNGRFVFTGTSQDFTSRCPALLEEIFSVHFERYTCNNRKEEVFGAWGVPYL